MVKARHKTRSHTTARKDDRPSYVKLFETFGVSLSLSGSGQASAEECPFCGGPKFAINAETGQYDCKRGNCGATGNALTFIRWAYENSLKETTDVHRRALRRIRDWPLQTINRHGFAWNEGLRCWLLPSKSPTDEVVNLLRYYPHRKKLSKINLPGLCVGLYGLEKLSDDADRKILFCEGAFDAVSLDQHLRDKKTRKRYDILATPGANTFKPEWAKFFQGRTVRIVFDNDKAGRDGQDRVAKILREAKVRCDVSVLEWPSGYPEKCDLSDLIKGGENVAEFTQQYCQKVATTEQRLTFTRGDLIEEEKIEWMDAGHVTFATSCDLSGLQGTHKSDIARDYAARGTAGLTMPGSKEALHPFNVIYFTSEDRKSVVRKLVDLNGGDLKRLFVHDITENDEPIDLLDCLEEVKAKINELRARLVIIDAVNSFTSGDISTDSRARRSLTGRTPLQTPRHRVG